jgi:hypothetical protein
MSIHTTTLILIALTLPRISSPLFHRVGSTVRVDSIEFTRRLMAARMAGGAA